MKRLFLDIETVPTQLDFMREEIARPILESYESKAAALNRELAELRPPANYKDPAKIEEWIANEKPKKAAAIEAQIKACNGERDEKIEHAWRQTSFDGAYCQIVVIGTALERAAPVTLYTKDKERVLTLAAEAQLIKSFYAALELLPQEERIGMLWVGHNVIDFDLRVLYQRSVVHGIKPPFWIPFDAKPWGESRVFDTMLAWAGGRGRVSQDKLCRVLGIDAKGSELGDEIDGSRVWDFVREGRIADVATYCGGDVNRAREAYFRLTFAERSLAVAA